MEETKELQTTYKIFRYLIYLSLIVEFFEYAINPELLVIGVAFCAIFMAV